MFELVVEVVHFVDSVSHFTTLIAVAKETIPTILDHLSSWYRAGLWYNLDDILKSFLVFLCLKVLDSLRALTST